MRRTDSFFGYLRTSDGRLSLIMVAACALVIAYFIGRSLIIPLPKSYQLDFGAAQWIESSTASQTGYFRKTVYIPGHVDRAWIEIAASDNYELYVNNFKFDEKWLVKARPSNAYQIAAFLQQGKNVIAVHSNRISFPGAGQIRVRGFYSMPDSPLQEFISDSSWKASSTPDGIVGGYQWTEPGLDDSFWANAHETTSGERVSTVQAVKFDPRLLQAQPVGKWIVPQQPGVQQASFAYHLKLNSLRPQQVWMGVAATGPYDIIINGRLAFTQPVDLESVQLALAADSNGAPPANSSHSVEGGPLSEAPDLDAIEPPATPPIARLAGSQFSPPVANHALIPPRSTFPTMPMPPTEPSTIIPHQLGTTLPFTALAQPYT
ncbi:MAG: hypothetical protein ABSD31_18250, partial [Candidatus Binataceae bacterium]